MKIWRIFAKDFYRARILLLSYFLMLAVELAASSNAVLDHVAVFESFKTIVTYGALFQILMVWVIIGMLIHEDPIVDHRAFWLTRPVSRWDILGAKCLFLLVFLVFMPMIFSVIIALNNGFSMDRMAGILLGLMGRRMLLFLPCLLLASMTKTFGGYAFTSILFVVVRFPFSLGSYYSLFPDCLMRKISVLLENPRLNGILGDYSLAESLHLVKIPLDLLFAVSVVIIQFITRRTSRTVAWMGVWLIVSFLVGRFWGWDFIGANAGQQLNIADSVNISIDSRNMSVEDGPNLFACGDAFRAEKYLDLYWPLSVNNLLPGQFARYETTHKSKLIMPGQTLESDFSTRIFTNSVWEDGRSMEALTRIIPEARIVNLPLKQETSAPLYTLTKQDFNRIAGQPGILTGEALFKVYEWVLEARLPLQPGARSSSPNEQIAIDQARIFPNGLSVVVQYKNLASAEDDNYRDLYWRSDTVLLRNKVSGETLIASDRGRTISAWGPYTFPLLTSDINNVFQEVTFVSNVYVGGSFSGISKEWLKDAELIFALPQEVGYLKKYIRVEGFTLESRERTDYSDEGGRRTAFYQTGEMEFESENIFQKKPVPAREYYKSGGVKKELTYCGGFPQGTAKEYYATGELMYEYSYRQGRLEGRIRKYDKGGRVLSERNYHNGKLLEADVSQNP